MDKKSLLNAPLNSLSGLRKGGVYLYRIVFVSLKNFIKNSSFLYSSSLTYFSLLGIAPILAFLFLIARGFHLQKIIEANLLERFPEQNEAFSKLIEIANNFIDQTKTSAIAFVSSFFLIWAIVKIVLQLEKAIHSIWQEKQKSKKRRLFDFSFFVFMGPFILIVSSLLQWFLLQEFSFWDYEGLEKIQAIFRFLAFIIPYLLMGLLFFLIYYTFPRKKVSFFSALISGLIAGAIYEFIKFGYINFQIFSVRSDAIYGSFAAIPFFILWINISWLVLLYGAHLSYVLTFPGGCEYLEEFNELSQYSHKLLQIWIVKQFKVQRKALTVDALAKIGSMPYGLLKQEISSLVDEKILYQEPSKMRKILFNLNPSVSIDYIDDVVQVIDDRGLNILNLIKNDELIELNRIFQQRRSGMTTGIKFFD